MNGLYVPNPRDAVDTQGKHPAEPSAQPTDTRRRGSRPAHRAQADGLYGDFIESSSLVPVARSIWPRAVRRENRCAQRTRPGSLRTPKFPPRAIPKERQRSRPLRHCIQNHGMGKPIKPHAVRMTRKRLVATNVARVEHGPHTAGKSPAIRIGRKARPLRPTRWPAPPPQLPAPAILRLVRDACVGPRDTPTRFRMV